MFLSWLSRFFSVPKEKKPPFDIEKALRNAYHKGYNAGLKQVAPVVYQQMCPLFGTPECKLTFGKQRPFLAYRKTQHLQPESERTAVHRATHWQ